MAQVKFKGNPINLAGNFPKLGDVIDNFTLADNGLKDVSLKDFDGRWVILSIFPSLDTPVCAGSVKRFNEEASELENSVVLCISKDLPFAQARFCGIEGINNALVLSAFRNQEFGKQLGVGIVEGPVNGLLARAVIVLNPKREVIYTELVPEVTDRPNYDQCIAALNNNS